MPVPLIPFDRPAALILAKQKPAKSAPVKPPKKERHVAAPKTKASRFELTNSENITSKHEDIQMLWHIVSKMDPEGVLFVNDVGIIGIEGDVPADRTLKALKFTADEQKLLRPYAILDAEEADDVATARGKILTLYQLLELAHQLGRQAEAAQVTKAIVKAVEPAAADDDEEFDDEDDESDSDEDDPDDDEDDDE